MTHLTDEQIADAATGGLAASQAAHLSVCAACAAKVRELEAVVREVAAVDVPEPSPLFWQHFTRNVKDGIDEPQTIRAGWRLPWVAAWATATVVVISLITLLVLRPAEIPHQVVDGQPRVEEAPAGFPAAGTEALDIDDDEAWAVVRSLAEDLHYDDAREAGVVPRDGAVEHAATELSDDERAQLIRLLEEDLSRGRNTDGE